MAVQLQNTKVIEGTEYRPTLAQRAQEVTRARYHRKQCKEELVKADGALDRAMSAYHIELLREGVL